MRKFVVVVFLFISGCTTMDEALTSWDGFHIKSAINQLGPYSNKGEYKDQPAYSWSRRFSFELPETYNTQVTNIGVRQFVNTTKTGGGTINSFCEVILTVDRFEYINGWAYQGNGCSGGKFMKEPDSYDDIYKKPVIN